MIKIKLFFRADSKGHTVILGKALGTLSSESEAIFEGIITEDMLLIGKTRKPLVETQTCSTLTLLEELGRL